MQRSCRVDRGDWHGERRWFRGSRAERLGAGNVVRGRRGRRIAVGDVLESGDHDADAGRAERIRADRHIAVLYEQPNRGQLVWFAAGTGNIADNAIVPGSYFSYQLNPNLWLGMSVNAPFGLSVGFPDQWAGRDYAAGDSHLRTYNATPSIAYRFSDLISVGVGVQIEYADASAQ